MKKLILLFLFLITLSINAQTYVQLDDCNPTPSTYGMVQQPKVYTPDPCTWEGTTVVVESTTFDYPTYQVAALSIRPTYLPYGYMVKYVNGLHKVYLHPLYYQVLTGQGIDAVNTIHNDGFCNEQYVYLQVNLFPNTQTTYHNE